MAPKATVRYRVTFPSLAIHRVRVDMEIDDAPEGGVPLAMAVWTPGSYLVREFARHVVSVSACRVSGDPVPVVATAKNEWRVDTKPGKRVDVTFELHADELSVRTNHVDPDHAFLQPAATFPRVRGREGERVTVAIEPPQGWRVFTSLPLVGENLWAADNLDELYDSPFEIGPHPVLSFAVDDVPHRIAVFGEGNVDPLELTGDTHSVCLAAKEIFPGPHPCRSYTFLFHVEEGARGGLEHHDSSVCGFSPHSFRPERNYLRQLSLVAHEYFHLWNGKRIRPRELGPFDYDRENPCRLLWVAEGVTSYYQDLLLRRADLMSVPIYLDEVALRLRALAETPGRRVESVAEASFHAWSKLYRPHPGLRNQTVSYYLKGSIVALLLDLSIRDATEGERSLDDAMQMLWELCLSRPDEGYTEEEIAAALSEAAGRDLGPEVAAWTRGTAELPLEPVLATHGLELVPREVEPGRAWLGLTVGEEGGRTVAREVLDGGPAAFAGVSPGDELLAFAGWRLGSLPDRLANWPPGEAAPILVSRRGRVRELVVAPVVPPRTDLVLRPLEGAGEREKSLFTRWLDAPLAVAAESAPPAPDPVMGRVL